MEKYIRVDWPESQEWNELANYSDEYGIYMCDMIAFVPEELYNQVKGHGNV
jgi:hypothetical protein